MRLIKLHLDGAACVWLQPEVVLQLHHLLSAPAGMNRILIHDGAEPLHREGLIRQVLLEFVNPDVQLSYQVDLVSGLQA